jgi:hypothetical protein
VEIGNEKPDLTLYINFYNNVRIENLRVTTTATNATNLKTKKTPLIGTEDPSSPQNCQFFLTKMEVHRKAKNSAPKLKLLTQNFISVLSFYKYVLEDESFLMDSPPLLTTIEE